MFSMLNLLMKILECMSLLLFSVLVLSAIIMIKLIFVGIKLCSISLLLTQVNFRFDHSKISFSSTPCFTPFSDIQWSSAVDRWLDEFMDFIWFESSARDIVDDDVEVARNFGWMKARRSPSNLHAEWKISKINFEANKCFFNYTKCKRKTFNKR